MLHESSSWVRMCLGTRLSLGQRHAACRAWTATFTLHTTCINPMRQKKLTTEARRHGEIRNERLPGISESEIIENDFKKSRNDLLLVRTSLYLRVSVVNLFCHIKVKCGTVCSAGVH